MYGNFLKIFWNIYMGGLLNSVNFLLIRTVETLLLTCDIANQHQTLLQGQDPCYPIQPEIALQIGNASTPWPPMMFLDSCSPHDPVVNVHLCAVTVWDMSGQSQCSGNGLISWKVWRQCVDVLVRREVDLETYICREKEKIRLNTTMHPIN